MDWLRIEQVGAESLAELEALQSAGGITDEDILRRQTVRRVVGDLLDAGLVRPASDGELLRVADELQLGIPEVEVGWRRLLAIEVFGR